MGQPLKSVSVMKGTDVISIGGEILETQKMVNSDAKKLTETNSGLRRKEISITLEPPLVPKVVHCIGEGTMEIQRTENSDADSQAIQCG